MSKELGSLKRIKKLLEDKYGLLIYVDDLDLIETVLKDYETMKEIRYTSQFDLKQVNKEHKALEIIKKYIPYYIEIETDENGKIIMSDHEHLVQDELAKEEYDLLKEVLL